MSLLALSNLLPPLGGSKGQIARPLDSIPKELSRMNKRKESTEQANLSVVGAMLGQDGRKELSLRKFINIIIF